MACPLLIVVVSLLSGCATNPLARVDVGAGFKIIRPTTDDIEFMSDGLVKQIVAHNKVCEKAPKCQKSDDTPTKISGN